MTTRNEDQMGGGWCDDCHGYTHMPWCPNYEEPVAVMGTHINKDGYYEIEIERAAQNAPQNDSGIAEAASEAENVPAGLQMPETTSCCPRCDYSDEQEQALRGDDDTISDCEPEPEQEQQLIRTARRAVERMRDIPRFLEKNDVPVLASIAGECLADLAAAIPPDSPALRRTRSIVHHAEMVAEQEKRDDSPLATPETRRSILDAIEADKAIDALGDEVRQQRLVAHSTFDDAWDAAPESLRRVTEIEAAEFFYYAGRRDRETEILRDVNEMLRGVVERIGREGRK